MDEAVPIPSAVATPAERPLASVLRSTINWSTPGMRITVTTTMMNSAVIPVSCAIRAMQVLVVVTILGADIHAGAKQPC